MVMPSLLKYFALFGPIPFKYRTGVSKDLCMLSERNLRALIIGLGFLGKNG